MTSEQETLSVAVRERLVQRFGGDRAAVLYGYWQLLATPTGAGRLRGTLGAEGYRSALAALAQAGVDLPRQAGAGPAAGLDTYPGGGVASRLTVDRQLLRQARMDGLFGWGAVSGQCDVSLVRAGAAGYPRDALVVGLTLAPVMPLTYHAAELRARPSLATTSPPVLARLGGFADGGGHLLVSGSLALSLDDTLVAALFGDGATPIEVIVYRCYDGPAAEDTSFAIARGVFR
jgi:hypothetical protein